MLLVAIDEHHWGTYDFIYLPIDFKVSKSCMDGISLGKKITYGICTSDSPFYKFCFIEQMQCGLYFF